MQYELRPCQPGDEERLSLLACAAFLGAFAGVHSGDDILAHCREKNSPQQFLRWLRSADSWVCIAEIDRGAPVGYAVVCPCDLPIEISAGDVELRRLYVLPSFHGEGVGAALMDWAIRASREQGFERLILGVNATNEKAKAFYGKHQFETIGARVFQVGQELCHDLILARKL